MTAISVQKWDADKNYPSNPVIEISEHQRRALKRLVMAAMRGRKPNVSLENLYDLEYKLTKR